MLNVAWKITMGNTTLQADGRGALLSLECNADLSVPLNSCRIVLAGTSKVAALPADPVKVELGYDSDLKLVFTGQVAAVQLGLERHRVDAFSAFGSLTAARVNAVYDKQAAGEIATDLLGQLKIGKSSVEDGEKFAGFAVSNRTPVWDNLRGLAARCGFDFYADTEDKAVFKKYAAGRTHAFGYGGEILSYEYSTQIEPIDGVEIYGESPAGQGQGEDASSWLTKKPVKGAAGKTSGNVLRVADPAARTENAAHTVAANLFQSRQVAARGSIRVIGAPQVRLGDAVQVSSMGDSARDGVLKVAGVRHLISARTGFTTRIRWERN
jgi:hypothetical protein